MVYLQFGHDSQQEARHSSVGGELSTGGGGGSEVRSGWTGRAQNPYPINIYWDKLKIRPRIGIRNMRSSYCPVPFAAML